jgi:ribosomal protein S12 methylthiotransferase accessory factor
VLPVAHTQRAARKYGNRAVVYAHVEAGQALQNAQLMAAAVEAAGCMRGDAIAQAVLDLLRPHVAQASSGQWLPMPAFVVGSRPSAAQAACQSREQWIQLTPAVTLPSNPGFAFSAGPVTEGTVSVFTLGRSGEPATAATKAEAEAWERLGWLRLSSTTQASRCALPHAIDPSTLVAYSRRQHAAAGFPFRPFDPRRRYLWCSGVDTVSGREVQVPAECVHALSALPATHQAHALTNSSTSGVAAWPDAQGALALATLEVVERDAFVRAWLARRPLASTRLASLPAEARRRVEALRASGCRADVLRLPSPWAPVYAVFVQHAARHFTGVTACAHFDRERAVLKALDEAEGRAAQAAAFRPEPIERAAQVHTPRDIHHYWQMARFFRQADFLVAPSPAETFAAQDEACGTWNDLLALCAHQRRPLVAVDITPAGASVHQGRHALRVVRAVVPGLLPIWFTHGTEPAGLPAYRQAAGPRAGRPACLHPFS